MTYENEIGTESQIRFMDIYFKYIEEVGGGNEWAIIHREYADLKIQSLLLLFSQELIIKGKYENSECKKMMLQYFDPLPEGNEIAMIDSHLATLNMSLDHVTKRIQNMNKAQGKGGSLVQLLTQITNVNGLYLPYNSVLLIEFIEQYKLLKEKQKQIKNGRSNK